VIRSFLHKGLEELHRSGSSRRVRADLVARVVRRLNLLDQAGRAEDLDLPGFGFHRLKGRPIRYSVWVNGPWRITFEWVDGEPWRVDLEQYH
jgi:proteic killer suppression protein